MDSDITKYYYTSNKLIYSSKKRCSIISNIVSEFFFDATVLAKLLQDAFEASSYKTYTKLAEDIGSNKATVSRTLTASPQSLTNKPSKPNRDFLINISKALNVNVNRVLMLAGYAPLTIEPSIDEIADEEFKSLFYDSAHWSEENRVDALEMAKDVFRRYQQREKQKHKLEK